MDLKTKVRIFPAVCALILLLTGSSALAANEERSLIPAGTPFGVRVEIDGVVVAELEPFVSDGDEVSPALEAGIQAGDILKAVNDTPITDAASLSDALGLSNGNSLEISLLRNAQQVRVTLNPKKSDETGQYKAGVWVRDHMAGIGTMTYIDPDSGAYGGLGHGICDLDSEVLLPIRKGEVFGAVIEGILRGKAGEPGELRGVFEKDAIGDVQKNSACGVFGCLARVEQSGAIPVGTKSDVRVGKAELWSTVGSAQCEKFEVEISRICDENALTKNFLVTVTDQALLERTGGIVQGMSGSPIIQDGKFVGALTHVLVNYPTKGYGIYLENMLSAAA